VTDAVVVEADGGSRGNPGPAGFGAVVFDATTGAVLAERAESLGTATNNVAEYRGLIAGLTAARELGARRVAVRMDSKLVVEQMKGTWQVKHEGLRALAREAAALRSAFDSVTFEWIPRERNKHADRLANEAMDRAAGKTAGASGVHPPGTTSGISPENAGNATRTAAGRGTPAWAPATKEGTRLVLVRHGSTEHSLAQRFSGRNDLPLDDAGRDQAAHLAKRDFGPVAALVSSPLPRAMQTAEALGSALGVAVRVDDDLVETDFGVWEGLTFEAALDVDGALLREWMGRDDVAPPGGESFAAAGARAERARDSLVAAYPGRTVIVVSHVTPIKWLICAALAAPPVALFRLHLDTASVSAVDYYPDGNCSVRFVNDTSHLR
jgi:probable phosphoglycerate mutase